MVDLPSRHEDNLITLDVLYQKSSQAISISPDLSLHQLCHDHLSSLFTLSPTQTLFKLVFKKPPTTLVSPGPSDTTCLHELGLSNQQKILLLTTDLTEVQRTDQAVNLQRKKESIRKHALENPIKLRNTSNNSQNLTYYRFHSIDLIPNLPFESRRRDLLSELSKHPSIKSQMSKYEFEVGQLGELHPWIDPHILGVNENSGQRIRLRLLTDDLKSVRPFSMVRRVLSHELAHNRFGPHDNDFKELDSTIHKGMLAHDQLMKSSAIRLGGAIGDHYEPPSQIEVHCATHSTPHQLIQAIGSSNSGHGGRRLSDPRRAAAEAALKRAKK